jgi:hypothetical protein
MAMHQAQRGLTIADVYLLEYEKLKEEQVSRIGFRDNLVYVTIAAVGAVLSFALKSPTRPSIFLVLPPLCFALGWTYLMNDQKISAIGQYLRGTLAPALQSEVRSAPVLTWELAHRADDLRTSRKLIQWLVDEVLFCVTAVVGIAAYFVLTNGGSLALGSLAVVELMLMALLGVQIARYAVQNRGVST